MSKARQQYLHNFVVLSSRFQHWFKFFNKVKKWVNAILLETIHLIKSEQYVTYGTTASSADYMQITFNNKSCMWIQYATPPSNSKFILNYVHTF
jgi:hypothetical protein